MENQDLNQPVTKKEFQAHTDDFKELKTDFTELKTDFKELKTDFKELKTDFTELKKDFHEFVDFTVKTVATKDDLKEEFKSYHEKALQTFATKEDMRLIVEKSEERILQSNHQVLSSNDGIAKEIKAMREEQSAHFGSHKRQDEEIVQVKHRLDKVEAHVGLT